MAAMALFHNSFFILMIAWAALARAHPFLALSKQHVQVDKQSNKQTNHVDLHEFVKANESQYSSLKVLRTRNIDLTLATKMDNPWKDAVDCYRSNENACSCGNWGRWHVDGFTPPACVKNTVASIYALAKFVGGKGYTVHLKGGSLLGAMRCGTFIPWDYDADFGVFTHSAEEAVILRNQINEWAGGPLKPSTIDTTVFGGPGLTEWRSSNPEATKTGNTHLDGEIRASHPDDPEMIPCVLNDIVLHCPANYNEYLTKYYGSDWKSSPKRWTDWATRKLGSGLKLDEARVDGCERRMSSIDVALAKMTYGKAFTSMLKHWAPREA